MLIEWDEASLHAWRRDHIRTLTERMLGHAGAAVRDRAVRLVEAGGIDDPAHVFTVAEEAARAEIDPSARFDFARIAYVARRAPGHGWDGFLPHALGRFHRERARWAASFPIGQGCESGGTTDIPRLIRQCRPGTPPYDTGMIQQIGFYNKNREFVYRCYDTDRAAAYLHENLGAYAARLFSAFPVPQGQSDYFLLAALFIEGGVSADVCSVNRAGIFPLLQGGGELGFIAGPNGLEKKFFFARPRHPLVRAYLDRLTDYLDRCAAGQLAFDYHRFSGSKAFERFVLDSLCEDDPGFDPARVTLIDDAIYTAFVNTTEDEEHLFHADDNLPFRRTRLVGIADDLKLLPSLHPERRGAAILSSRPGHFFAQSDHVRVIGHDNVPAISRQAAEPVAVPAVHLFQTWDIGLSGHACLWQDGRFLRLESYLSTVAEEETVAGHWRGPHNANITREIEEPVIVAFGAGYGCYGHYLVDDLPRLGLARALMGEEAFARRRIVIPAKTPEWGISLLKTVLGLSDEAFLPFDHEHEFWLLRDAAVPSFLSRHYQFHPFVKEFYQSIGQCLGRSVAPDVTRPFRRLCLSRRAWEPHKTNQRVFLQQELFEAMAAARGYEIIAPETLSIPEQIRLLAETRCQIGEHGSAQHASVYNRYGMTVGIINPLTEVQTNLGRLYGDTDILAYADSVHGDDKGNTFYSLSEEKLMAFFDAVETADRQRDSFYRVETENATFTAF